MNVTSERQTRLVRRVYVSVWCSLGVILIVLGIYFGLQTFTYFELRPLVTRPADYPPRGWSSVPRPLADLRVSTAEGSTISFYGHQFEVSWEGIDKKMEDPEEGWVRFKQGKR